MYPTWEATLVYVPHHERLEQWYTHPERLEQWYTHPREAYWAIYTTLGRHTGLYTTLGRLEEALRTPPREARRGSQDPS